jgi:hypothetical protein
MLTYEAFNNYKLFLENQSKAQNYSALLESNNDSSKDQLMQQAKEDVERCVSLIMGKYKFFGEFVYKFRFLYTYDVDTMATDGKNIFVNPQFCSTLTDAQIVFIVCHEILHNVLIHFLRGANKGVEHRKWNIATDLEINPMLVEEGLLTREEVKNDIKGLYEDKYLGLPAEEIYDALPSSPPKPEMTYPANIGDVIKTKDGKYGQIDAINADGTFEIKEITFDEAKRMLGV